MVQEKLVIDAMSTLSQTLVCKTLQHAMEEMGKKPTPEELEAFMQEVDLDGNGTVGNIFSPCPFVQMSVTPHFCHVV